MSNSNLTSYNFHNSDIRVEQNDKGEVLFCLADVCASLNLTNATVIANQVKDEFGIPKLNLGVVTRPDGSRIEANFITEPQLYFVMMRSRAKVAREFRQWICNEVIPEIRKRGAYVAKSETKTPATKKCWYVEQLTALFESYGVNREVLALALDITSRAFKQGYAIGLNNSTDTKDKQPKADDRLTITDDEAQAIDHVVHYHQLFRPGLLKAYELLCKIEVQADELKQQLREIPKEKIFDAATAADFSVLKLKSFNTVKIHKNELVTRG